MLKSIRSLARYVVLLILSPLRWFMYLLSGFVPRSKKIWVFGSWDGHQFSDNSKWFYIHCVQNNYPEKCVWITRNKILANSLNEIGYEAYYFISVKGLFYSLRAKFFFIDHTSQDINFFTSRNAILVNQFHGIPLKKLRRDIELKNNFMYKVFSGKWYEKLLLYITRPYVYEKMDYFSVTSQENKKIFSRAFDLPADRVHVIGYSRNDAFMDRDLKLNPKDEKILKDVTKKKEGYKKIVLYLPTWRDHDRERVDPINWNKLNKFLSKNKTLFISKLHGYDKLNVNRKQNLSNILFLDHTVDIYPLLRITDILLTDYSSIYFDFLLTQKPIVFYCYDLHDYMNNARSFYYDYEKVTPGDKANNFDELLNSLSEAINREEDYQSKWESMYKKVLDLSFSHKDGNSGKRLYQSIKDHFQFD